VDIYEVLLHGDQVTIQLSAEDAKRLGVAPQHAAEEVEEKDKPSGK
jgi:hypothetical protein